MLIVIYALQKIDYNTNATRRFAGKYLHKLEN
jgi:hypothetical protein